VESVPRAEKVLTHTAMVAIPYSLFAQLRLLAAANHGQVLDEDFGADVTVTARFAVEHFPVFQAALSELTNGKVQAEIIETGEILMPLK
jgi:putative IMPACT (imprinted ancient) family translation regulator